MQSSVESEENHNHEENTRGIYRTVISQNYSGSAMSL